MQIIKNSSNTKAEFDGQVASLCIGEVSAKDSGIYECVLELDDVEICTDCKLHIKGESTDGTPADINKANYCYVA